jgi:hypothetical protein
LSRRVTLSLLHHRVSIRQTATMKVIEKGTNRKAEVHVYVEGKVPALAEYGGYIDPKDKAICCYVAVDEDYKPRFGGRFSGTVSIICMTLLGSG